MMQPTKYRALDIVLSVAGILVTLPIMISIGLLGYFLNGSPLFFQTRVGREQKAFTLVKFRTMKMDTKSVGTHLVDVSSITGFGAFLRDRLTGSARLRLPSSMGSGIFWPTGYMSRLYSHYVCCIAGHGKFGVSQLLRLDR